MKKLSIDKLSQIIKEVQKDFPNNRIDELIKKSNFNGDNLAEMLGYSNKSSISGLRHSNIKKKYFFENNEEGKKLKKKQPKDKGEGDISSKDLICLSRVFGVSVDYILGLSNYQNIGNKEIMEITGLSEEAIETLRKLNMYNPQNASNPKDLLLCEANSDIYSQTKKAIDFLNYALTNTFTESYNNNEYTATIFELLWDYIDNSNKEYMNPEDRSLLGDFITPISNGFEDSKIEIHRMYKESIIYQLRRILDKYNKDVWWKRFDNIINNKD